MKQSLLKQELQGQLVELSSSKSKAEGLGAMSLEQQTIYYQQIEALKGRIMAKSFKVKQQNKFGKLHKRSPKVA